MLQQTKQSTINDNSNPQQGSSGGTELTVSGSKEKHGTPPRRMFKVPPTKKDERKLFVGGLPANSKYDSKINVL